MVKQLIATLLLLVTPCLASDYLLATGQDGTQIVYFNDRLNYADWPTFLKMWQPFPSETTAGTYYDYGPLAKDGSQTTTNSRPEWSITAGGCYDFDGTADNILIGDVLTLGFNLQDFTAMAWAKIDVTAANQIILTTRRWEIGIGDLAAGLSSATAGDLAAYYWTSSAQTLDSNITATTNTWYHLAMVTQDNTGHFFYVNGVLAASDATTADTTYVSDNVRIGSRHDVSSYFWNGMIDDVRLYSRSLASNEVMAVYNETKAAH